MTTEQILSQIEAINAELNIHRHYENYMKPNVWWITITWKNDDGIDLKVSKNGMEFSPVLLETWLAFDRTANKGLPLARLAAPIEHQDEEPFRHIVGPVMPPSRFDFEDEIPF